MPVTREELEQALRRIHAAVDAMRDDLLSLGAQVADLTRHLTEREAIDPVELELEAPRTLEQVRASDETWPMGVELGPPLVDKYEVESPPVPCDELLPLCNARCCTLSFALTTQDLDGGVVRWDYSRPYRIRQRDDGRCTHFSHDQPGCTIYGERPGVCRKYDCRDDDRIWTDYENRVPAPPIVAADHVEPDVDYDDVVDRVRRRQLARGAEMSAVMSQYLRKRD